MPFSSKDLTNSLFKQIFESGIIGLLFSKFDGTVVEANDAFLNFIGYTRKELQDGFINWRDITPPEYMAITDIAIKKLKTVGKSTSYEKEYFRKDGSRVSLLMGSVRIKDATNYENMTYAIDISASKKIEKELAHTKEDLESRVGNRTKDLSEANRFLQSLIENIPNMIFVKNAKDLKFVRFNKAGEELLGLNRTELLGKSDFDFFPKKEAEFFIQKDRDVLAGKIILDIPEEPITTKNGPKILHTKKIPLLDELGNPKYLLGISEDITEIKKLETERYHLFKEQTAREEAEKNVERLELLADANTLLTSSLDYESTLKNFYQFMVSRVADWCHITIFKPEQKDTPQFVFETSALDKDTLIELLKYRWKLIKDVDDALDLNTDESELLVKLKKEGFKSFINVLLRARGSTIGYILLATKPGSKYSFDFSDLQFAEELADKASHAIDNSRLFSEAQRANQLKDEFLATLSHELRTPLNIIHGYSELLKNFSKQMSEKEIEDSLDAIYRNAVDQANIVNDILDVSKIITGKMNIDLTLLSPDEIINSIVKNTEHMVTLKNIKIITDLPDSPCMVMMDPTRLQQIIWNLVSNAIKFTQENGKITIKNYIEDNNCVIEVQDTGIGIGPAFLPYMFERFRQEDGSMTRKYGGLGLGLAIVRHLVEMHGGTIEARSKGRDLGSQFIVKIPKVTKTLKIKNILSSAFTQDCLKGVNILLIEDSRDNRLLINSLLSNYGANLHEADSVKMARTILKKFTPDLILCDIGMPEEDGLEFIKKFRAEKNSIPAIALTAYVRSEEKAEFLNSGFNSHVPKPVSVQTLLTEIKKLI